MCKSVPQIAVFSSLISTSFGPISGTGTCSIQMPLAASRLTSAFIIDCDMDVSFAARIIRVQSDKIAAFHGHVAGCAASVHDVSEEAASGIHAQGIREQM